MKSSLRTSRPLGATLAVASALLASAALGGCGNGLARSSGGDDDAGVTRVTASASPVTDPSSSPSAAGSSSASGTSAGSGTTAGSDSTGTTGTTGSSGTSASGSQVPPATRGIAPCDAGQLSYGVDTPPGGASAGSRYVLLTFKNTGGVTCTLDGHPGVSFVGGGDGTQLGRPAARFGALKKVTLRPSASTTALLKIAEAGDYDASTCVPTTADGFRIYPPGSRAAVFVRYSVQACQGDVGSGSPQLQVSAVGGAG